MGREHAARGAPLGHDGVADGVTLSAVLIGVIGADDPEVQIDRREIDQLLLDFGVRIAQALLCPPRVSHRMAQAAAERLRPVDRRILEEEMKTIVVDAIEPDALVYQAGGLANRSERVGDMDLDLFNTDEVQQPSKQSLESRRIHRDAVGKKPRVRLDERRAHEPLIATQLDQLGKLSQKPVLLLRIGKVLHRARIAGSGWQTSYLVGPRRLLVPRGRLACVIPTVPIIPPMRSAIVAIPQRRMIGFGIVGEMSESGFMAIHGSET